ADTWINLGGLSIALRRPDDAQKAFEEVVELLNADSVRMLPGASALSLKCQQERARALNNLGIIHRQAGRLVEAEKASREALAVKEALAETFPSVPQYRLELARSFHNLGALLTSLQRQNDARVAYEKAVSIYERLATDPGAMSLITVEL